MQYFLYSPLDMSEQEAYELAKNHFEFDSIVRVRRLSTGRLAVSHIPLAPGERPQALPETYLVRVEPDGSLRTIQRALI